MKVVYVLCSSKALGGASKAFRSMLAGLMQHGIEPMVVLPGHGEIEKVLEEMHVPTLSLTYRFATYPDRRTWRDWVLFVPRLLARLWVNRRAVQILVQTLRKNDIALIHTNVGIVDVGFRTARRLGIPHIYHIREYADLDFDMHYFPAKCSFRRQLAMSSSYSICITRAIQQYHGQADNGSSRVIYDGIRSIVKECPTISMGCDILFAGRIEYSKGLDILLQAYNLCQERGVALPMLKVAGRVEDKKYMDNLQLYIKKHGMGSCITFLGERSDIESLMRQARVLVVPSRNEGFGLCMPEAMFNRCLVIAHDTAGTHEQLENGLNKTGEEIALRFKSIEKLAEHLQEVCTATSSDIENMTARAFGVVNQLYSTETHVSQVYQFYKDILNKERRLS